MNYVNYNIVFEDDFIVMYKVDCILENSDNIYHRYFTVHKQSHYEYVITMKN